MIEDTAETVHVYIHCDGELVDVIKILDAIPERDIVGVANIFSEKLAVIVTTFEFVTRLLLTVSESTTVGAILSIKYVRLSVPV